ncbi:MAG TPA: hypothetical protein DCE23_08685 [Firmicutes bacterium]|nr:hypothetical protein [Bacillota bacterium]
MINYRKGKEKIKIDEYGSLYIDYDKINPNERPIIYIGGQMEHRCHILEQTGYTADPGHNMFDGSWFYDYSTLTKDKSNINVQNFTKNLLDALKQAHIGAVDLVTESYGGLIGAYASSSPLIHKVVAIHPPILGTPLANKKLIRYAIKQLEFEYKLLAHLINIILNDQYGFEQENKNGIYDSRIRDNTDLSKLIVVGSHIDYNTEKNELIKSLYKLILKLTNKQSDGVVIFEPSELQKLGITYIEEDTHLSHFDAGSKENIEKAKIKALKR